MVEGHSVHRVAAVHTKRLVQKIVHATSPNGRFAEGAAEIDGSVFDKISAVGKNLFAFFQKDEKTLVVRIHFGMSGRFPIFDTSRVVAPEPTSTTRLVLSHDKLVAPLSAMTCELGDMETYAAWRSKLGQDPLDPEADVEALWASVTKSKKAVSALLMDQSFFAGVGNIYRAEVLFVARVYPRTKGCDLSRVSFDRIWAASVQLMGVGKATGRILSLDEEEAVRLGDPGRRRYVYNQATCAVCGGGVSSYDEASRTVWCCFQCQRPEAAADGVEGDVASSSSKVFNSHCAQEPLEYRIRKGFGTLSVPELREELKKRGLPHKGGKKADLVKRLARKATYTADLEEHTADLDMASSSSSSESTHGYHRKITSPHFSQEVSTPKKAKSSNTNSKGKKRRSSPFEDDKEEMSEKKKKKKKERKASKAAAADDENPHSEISVMFRK